MSRKGNLVDQVLKHAKNCESLPRVSEVNHTDTTLETSNCNSCGTLLKLIYLFMLVTMSHKERFLNFEDGWTRGMHKRIWTERYWNEKRSVYP